jgi:hypothetical protein
MNETLEIRTAADAVRCLYLARVAEREGHKEAARRLHGRAVACTEKHLNSCGRNGSALPLLETRPRI